jgi:hypothetical protein
VLLHKGVEKDPAVWDRLPQNRHFYLG